MPHFRSPRDQPRPRRARARPTPARAGRQILGSEVYIHQSRVNYKPGYGGTGFYWHSDFETWHSEDGMPRMRALSVSIALTSTCPSTAR